jgi:hypothetical protein
MRCGVHQVSISVRAGGIVRFEDLRSPEEGSTTNRLIGVPLSARAAPISTSLIAHPNAADLRRDTFGAEGGAIWAGMVGGYTELA